jgi:PAS domain S-box-containing protein
MGLLGAIALSNYFSAHNFIKVSERSKTIFTVMNEVEDLFFWLTNAESRQRGFLLTGDEYNLKYYKERSDSVFIKLHFVKAHTQDNNEIKNILPVLEDLIKRRLAKLDYAVIVRKERGFTEAAKLIETGDIRAMKDSIRTLIYRIQEIESKQNNIIETNLRKSAEWTVINTIIGYIAAFILLVSIFTALIKEIAARIRSEEKTKKFAEEINDLYNNAPVGYYSLDPEGRITAINNTQLNWLGYDREELVNKKMFSEMLEDESVPKFNEHFTTLKQGKNVFNVELNVVKKNGNVMPALWNSTGIRNDKKEFLMSRSVLFDNTELSRNKHNLELLNKELQSFAYSVSHDLRAPLRHINGFIDLLTLKSGDKLDEQGKRYLTIIHEASRKMGTLIDELLSFSRMSRQEFLKTKVDLNAILADSIQSMMEYNNHSSRKIEWIIKELPVTECDPAMIRIVFNNLISNAVKFTGKKESAVIEIGSFEKNRQVIIYIKDNGAGFDMQYSSNLFGVFQRLHRQDEFEGNGIGLATVRRIINRHGGSIWAESRLGEGATFYFSLPAA